jgi:ethanolamine utilization protein EutQ (cupin superfamily)
VNSGSKQISIARMTSPAGWREPPQIPEFDEYTIVLDGTLQAATTSEMLIVHAGEAVYIPKGERVQYSTPQGAVSIAVCLPAFSPDLVHRETE